MHMRQADLTETALAKDLVVVDLHACVQDPTLFPTQGCNAVNLPLEFSAQAKVGESSPARDL